MTIKFGYGWSPASGPGSLEDSAARAPKAFESPISKPYRIRIPFVSRFESKPFRKNILESNAGGEGGGWWGGYGPGTSLTDWTGSRRQSVEKHKKCTKSKANQFRNIT